MADNLSIYELTAHYVALAQNDPQKFDQIKNEIQDSYRLWANGKENWETSKRNKDADAVLASVLSWFAQIEQTAQLLQTEKTKDARTAYNTACKELDKAILNRSKFEDDDAMEYEEEEARSGYLRSVYAPEEDDDEPEYLGKEVFRLLGPKKTAAKYIEEIQDQVKKDGFMSAEQIAMVLAARQLANTIPGDKSRLVNTQLDQITIKEHADKLLESEAFQEYIEEHRTATDLDNEELYGIDPKLLTEGHGGELEKDFAASVRSRDDLKELPDELFSRYKKRVPAQYASYDEFINAGKKDFLKDGTGKITSGDVEVARHAARMLTAFEMKNRGKVYNQKYFDQKAAEMYKSPQFQFIVKHDPEKLNLITTGNFTAYAEALNQYMVEAKQTDPDSPARSIERANNAKAILGTLTSGTIYGTVAEKQELEAYTKSYNTAMDSYRFLGLRTNQDPDAFNRMRYGIDGYSPEEGKKASERGSTTRRKTMSEDAVEGLLISSKEMVRFLDEKRGDPAADKLKTQLMKVVRTGETYFNPPQFKDKKGKTAAQQLEEYKINCAKKFRESAEKFSEYYGSMRDKDFQAKKKTVMAGLKTPEILKRQFAGNTSNDGSKAENSAENYLPKRGPKYRAMVQAAKEYTNCYGDDGEPDPAAKMKLIDAVLAYQKGKEKVMSGDAGHRFDNSMALLANVTIGTPMEKYLDQQIANVNMVRGAKPGSKDYLTKEGIFAGFKADKQPALQEQEIQQEQKDIQPLLSL